MTLVMAINKYFGKKEGQTLKDFATEFQALTPKDKTDLCDMLSKELNTTVTLE